MHTKQRVLFYKICSQSSPCPCAPMAAAVRAVVPFGHDAAGYGERAGEGVSRCCRDTVKGRPERAIIDEQQGPTRTGH